MDFICSKIEGISEVGKLMKTQYIFSKFVFELIILYFCHTNFVNMATSEQLEVSKLKLDLKNFRTVPQKTEMDAIKAMIAISPDRFFAVMESLIEDGYHATENIIVLNKNSEYVVREGNRRIACMKLINGQYKISDFQIPDHLIIKAGKISSIWKLENKEVPCRIYTVSESSQLDKIISLTHGKGEKAAREPWDSVARARHNRDSKNLSEPALDLLEKYLEHGQNLTGSQKERWAGYYPLTVLNEALRFIHPRLGYKTIPDLTKKYPKIKHVKHIEKLSFDIGLEQLHYKEIRDTKVDFAVNYGVPPIVKSDPLQSSNTNTNSSKDTKGNKSSNSSKNSTKNANKAHSINSPKNVKELLKKFAPEGANRAKIVTINEELKTLPCDRYPIAFCFLLRSMFEISAKIYCKDNKISLYRPGGKTGKQVEKKLGELLTEITNHIITLCGNKREVESKLHGALTELKKKAGILSVTSMNKLIHDGTFYIVSSEIPAIFNQIFPLLEAMN